MPLLKFKELIANQSLVGLYRRIEQGANHWAGSGALYHRVVAHKGIAQTGIEKIVSGNVEGLDEKTTCGELKRVRPDDFESTINLLYDALKLEIYKV